jgi:hypothetical protein
MNNEAVRDIRRILNVVLALEAAFKASQRQHPPKPIVPARKPTKPKPIKLIKAIKPVGPQPPRLR